MNINTQKKLKRIRTLLRDQGVSYLVTRNLSNIMYLTGCEAHAVGDVVMLVKPSSVILYSDKRYEGTLLGIATKNPQVKVFIWDRFTPWDDIMNKVPKGAAVGFEKESEQSPYSYVLATRRAAKKRGVTLLGVSDVILQARTIKSPAEIIVLRKAHAIADKALALTIPMIKVGVTEIEIRNQLNIRLRHLSESDDISFATIVASGKFSAIPHAGATKRKIRRGDLITIDFGCTYQGYRSDMTRAVIVGKLGSKLEKILAVVLEAQTTAEKQARPGMSGQDIDKIGRDIIIDAGFGEYFTHSTGHGVGYDVHEKPHITWSPAGANVLEVGMVFTIEPGIYIPNFGGVRIENTGVMAATGFKSFSNSSKVITV